MSSQHEHLLTDELRQTIDERQENLKAFVPQTEFDIALRQMETELEETKTFTEEEFFEGLDALEAELAVKAE